MAKLIKTDGSESEYNDMSLQGWQTAVEGYVETVHLKDGRVMLVDGDAKMIGKKDDNLKASALVGYPIVGNILLLSKEEFYEEADLSDDTE